MAQIVNKAFVAGRQTKYTVKPTDALVFIMEGQSNQSEQQTVANFPYQSWVVPTLNFKIYWNPTFQPTGAWQDFLAGTNNSTFQTGVVGSDARLGYMIANQYPGQVYMIKFARQATGTKQLLPADQNYPHDWNVATGPNGLYSQGLNNFILPALADLVSQGKTPKIIGYDWCQGENEASDASPGDYAGRLNSILRGNIQGLQSGGYDISQLRMTIMRLHNTPNGSWPSQAFVRGVHESVSDNWFSTYPELNGVMKSSIYYNVDRLPLEVDVTHFTPTGCDLRGQMLANYHSQFLTL